MHQPCSSMGIWAGAPFLTMAHPVASASGILIFPVAALSACAGLPISDWHGKGSVTMGAFGGFSLSEEEIVSYLCMILCQCRCPTVDRVCLENIFTSGSLSLFWSQSGPEGHHQCIALSLCNKSCLPPGFHTAGWC